MQSKATLTGSPAATGDATKRDVVAICESCGLPLWLDDTRQVYCEGCEQ